MADESDKAPIQSVYAERIAADLTDNRKEQEVVAAQIDGLQKRLSQLKAEESWLSGVQGTLSVTPAAPEIVEPATDTTEAASSSRSVPQPRQETEAAPIAPADRMAAGRKATAKKPGSRKTTARKVTASRAAADKATSDRATSNKAMSGKATSAKAAAGKATSGRAASENASPADAAADGRGAEKPTARTPVAHKPVAPGPGSGRNTRATKTTAARTPAKKTPANKTPSVVTSVRESAEEPLHRLVLDLLLEHAGHPRTVREVQEDLAKTHPARATSAQTVRNNLERLVKKELAEKGTKQGSAMYTAQKPLAESTREDMKAGKVPAPV